MRFYFCFCFFNSYSYRSYNFAFGLKIFAITAGIKKYKSIIKNKKKLDKIVLLAISKSTSIEILISKALIGSNISHDEFALIDNKKNRKKNMNIC